MHNAQCKLTQFNVLIKAYVGTENARLSYFRHLFAILSGDEEVTT